MKKAITLDLVSRQKPDGSFVAPLLFDRKIDQFFVENKNLDGKRFSHIFAETFAIPNHDIRDAHYSVYQRILHEYKPKDHPELSRKCAFFSDALASRLLSRRAGTNWVPRRAMVLDIWDTCYCCWALLKNERKDDADKAVRWLLSKQSLNGGWACSTEYPMEDSDTTAAIVILFSQYKNHPVIQESVKRAFNWLSSLKNENGSFKTFDDSFGVPSSDTTAVVCAGMKLWGLDCAAESLHWLSYKQSSHWYKSDARLLTCLNYVFNGEETDNEIISWGTTLASHDYCLRFMGNIFIDSALWRNAISISSNKYEIYRYKMIA